MFFKKLKDMSPEEIQKQKNLDTWQRLHGKAITRRQLLAAGAISGGAYMVLPSLFSLISPSTAEAASCGSSGLPAFITVNLDGGACLAGNAIMLDGGGNMLPDYGSVGMGTTPTPVQMFGTTGPSFASTSGFLAGLQASMKPATIANTTMITVAVASNDDTASNPLDPTPLVVSANSSKDILPPLGTNRNQPAVLPMTPTLAVGSLSDIQNALTVQGAVKSLTASQKATIFQNIQNLSATQARNLANVSGASLLGALGTSATATNTGLISGTNTNTDPQTNTALKTVWNNFQGQDLRDAAVVYNALMGNAISAYIEMGGYDYHGTSAQNVLTQDTSAGTKVGRVLETAATVGKPIFVVVTTDGSTAAPPSSGPTPPSGDKGTHGTLFVFAYHPAGKPVATKTQLGAFKFGGTDLGVDTSTTIGGSPSLAIGAIVANYMNWAGVGANAPNVLNNALNSQQLPPLMVLQPQTG